MMLQYIGATSVVLAGTVLKGFLLLLWTQCRMINEPDLWTLLGWLSLIVLELIEGVAFFYVVDRQVLEPVEGASSVDLVRWNQASTRWIHWSVTRLALTAATTGILISSLGKTDMFHVSLYFAMLWLKDRFRRPRLTTYLYFAIMLVCYWFTGMGLN